MVRAGDPNDPNGPRVAVAAMVGCGCAFPTAPRVWCRGAERYWFDGTVYCFKLSVRYALHGDTQRG